MRVPRIDQSSGGRYPIADVGGADDYLRQSDGQALVSIHGEEVPIACLRCPDKPCALFSAEELASVIPGLAVSPDLADDVCPFGALTASNDYAAPTVDVDVCAGCGLCVSRCPVGAISLRSGVAQVCHESILHEQLAMEDVAFYVHRATVAEIVNGAPVSGDVYADTGNLAALTRLGERVGGQTEFRHFTRNALICLGMSAQLSKIGDNHSRVELVFTDGVTSGIAQLEPGDDLLDATRRLLSDLAHVIAAGKVPPENLSPCVVCRRLPNVRTDVYSVLVDVGHVLDLSIAILPVVALAAAVTRNLGTDELMQVMSAYSNPLTAVDELNRLVGVPTLMLVASGAVPRK